MRIDNLKMQLCIKIPYDRPTSNGVVLTRDAVEKAIEDFRRPLPIVLCDKDDKESSHCIGNIIGETSSVLWDDEFKVCEVITNGIVYHGGVDFVVKEQKDGAISDFRIASISILR